MICTTSTVDNTTIVCVDPPVALCHCHHGGVCANETDADSCTCASGTFGPYCNITAAACATTHCGTPLVGHVCDETVNGSIACIAPDIVKDGFDEDNYILIGAGGGAAVVILVVAYAAWYFNLCTRSSSGFSAMSEGGETGETGW